MGARRGIALLAALFALLGLAGAVLLATGKDGPPPAQAPALAPRRPVPRALAGDHPLPSFEAPAAGAAELEGHVVDERNRPVVGARLSLRNGPSVESQAAAFEAIRELATGGALAFAAEAFVDPEALEARTLAEAYSDPDGRFAFPPVPPGAYEIEAEAEGRATTTASAHVREGPPAILRIAMLPAQAVRVLVVDDDGAPVPGARVQAVAARRLVADEACAADGSVDLDDLPAGTMLFASATGHSPARASVRPGQEVRLTLLRLRRISGRVVSAGQPVAGADVETGPPGPTARSEADGRFVLDGVPAHVHEIRARSGWSRAAVEVDLRQRAPEGLLLQLRAASSLRVRVLDREGRPIAGAAAVITLDGGDEESLARTTDRDGLAVFEPLPAGVLPLDVTAPGRGAKELRVLLPPGRGRELIVRMETGHELLVRVEADAGVPLEGLRATLSQDFDRTEPWNRDAVGAGEAVLRFSDVSPGTYELAVLAGAAAAKLSVTVPSPPVAVRLGSGGRITGRVLDETGAAVPGVRVVAMPTAGFGFRSQGAVTDATGSFVLLGVPEEELSLRIDDAALAAPPVAARAGDRDVILRVAAPLAIEGQVLRSDGSPAPDLLIGVQPEGGGPGGVERAAADGTFRIEGLASGSYRLFADAGASSPAPVVARAGDRDVRLVIAPRLVVRGRAVGPGGAPVPSVRTGSSYRRVPTRDGVFELEGEGGAWPLILEAEDLPPVAVTALRREDGVADVGEVRFPAPALVLGEVVDDAGRPLTPCTLQRRSALAHGAEHLGVRLCDGRGRFELTDLPPGSSWIHVEAPGRADSAAVEVVLSAGEARQLRLVAGPSRP